MAPLYNDFLYLIEMCVRVCLYMCVRVYACACVCMHVRACVRLHVCVFLKVNPTFNCPHLTNENELRILTDIV